jgi:uncharacterized protein YecA (UPF0149 family)
MPPVSKLNLRLPADLKAEAEALTQHLGLSLNALCVMALRNQVRYLSKSYGLPPVGPAGLQAPTSPPPARPVVSKRASVPRVALNAPCPCGSGKKYKRCHGAPGMR